MVYNILGRSVLLGLLAALLFNACDDTLVDPDSSEGQIHFSAQASSSSAANTSSGNYSSFSPTLSSSVEGTSSGVYSSSGGSSSSVESYVRSCTYVESSDLLDCSEKAYKTTVIGSQVWMAENLNYVTQSGSACFGDVATNCGTYGRLYSWPVAHQICPEGWHLPTSDDWDKMLAQVASTYGYEKSEDGIYPGVARELKFIGNWKAYSSASASNSTGFGAQAGGVIPSVAASSTPYPAGQFGLWWSSTQTGTYNGIVYNFYFTMTYSDNNAYRYSMPEDALLSVRCLKN